MQTTKKKSDLKSKKVV